MRIKVWVIASTLVLFLMAEQTALAQSKDCGEVRFRGTWERTSGNLSQPTFWTFKVTDRKHRTKFQKGSISCRGDCDRAKGQPIAFRAKDFEFTLTYVNGRDLLECEIVNGDILLLTRNYAGDPYMSFRRSRR